MSEVKKINLSAIMKHTNENEVKSEKTLIHSPPDSQNITKTEDENKVLPSEHNNQNVTWDTTHLGNIAQNNTSHINSKISLKNIKAEKVKEEIVEDIPIKKKVVKDKQTLFYESLTSKVLLDDEKKNISAPWIISLKLEKTDQWSEEASSEKIKKYILTTPDKADTNIETSCELSKKDEYIKNHTTEQIKNWNVFNNYESDFKRKEASILNAIKRLTKIANLKKLTKTNKIFVSWIIITTILWVSFLFYVDPEIHSIENYKTSILDLAGQKMTQEEINIHQKDIIDDIAWKLTQNNLGGYQLDFEILVNTSWLAVYKFDGDEYNNKSELDIAIQNKLIALKFDKIRNYLKNKQ